MLSEAGSYAKRTGPLCTPVCLFQTLQSLLSSAKKGKPINEEDIPPPVATGGKPTPDSQPEPIREAERPSPEPAPAPPVTEEPLRDAPAPPSRPRLLTPPQKTLAVTPDTPLISPLTPSQPEAQHSGTPVHPHRARGLCPLALCRLVSLECSFSLF